MSEFQDFEAFDDPPIRIPYKGKLYEFPPADAQLAVWVNASRAGAETPLSEMSDAEQMRLLLGPAYDEMLKDGVSSKFFLRVQQVIMTDMLAGREAAALVYRAGVSPEAIAAELAANAESTTSSSTESGGKTRSRASMSDTTSRKAPQDRKPKKKASASRKSSSSGASSRRTGESSTTAD